MSVAVIIATYGEQRWPDLAAMHALPSAEAQAPGAEIRVHHHDRGRADCTLAASRNCAAARTSAEWLCFLDADDQLAPGYLDAMRTAVFTDASGVTFAEPRGANLEAIIGEPRALLIPHVQYVRDGRYIDWPKMPAAGRPVGEVNSAVIGTLVPRSLFLEVGGFREEPLYEDWSLWLRCIRAGARPVAVPDAVYLADGEPGRNTGTRRDREEAYWTIRREHEEHVRGIRWPA